MSSTRPDVAVVGGGVIGLSVAFELARRGRSVVVLERDRVGCGASRTAAGMLAPISESETDPPMLTDLALDSLGRYPAFVAEVERVSGRACGLRPEGTLWVALHRDHASELDHLAETLRRRNLAAEPLGAKELRRIEPGLSPRVVGGWRVPQDRQVDPRALCQALATAVIQLGGRIVEGVRIEEVDTRDRTVCGVRGQCADQTELAIDAACVVLAAGAWSEQGMAVPRQPKLGLRPVKGQLVRLRGSRPLIDHVIRTPEVYLVPRRDGDLLIGATMEEQGFDTTPTAGAVLDLLRRGFEALPGVYDLEFVEAEVGLRSAVADQLPVIGPAEGASGLYLAFGHCRNGVLLAPATAHHLAQWIIEGRPAREVEGFAPRHAGSLG